MNPSLLLDKNDFHSSQASSLSRNSKWNLICLQAQKLELYQLDCVILWNFPGKNTVVGCHFLFQGIFLTQGSSPCLLHWQADSLPLSHQGSPIESLTRPILNQWLPFLSLQPATHRLPESGTIVFVFKELLLWCGPKTKLIWVMLS